MRDTDIGARLAFHVKDDVLKQHANGVDYRFVGGVLPSYLLVAALAEGTVKPEQVMVLWRHSTDQILDELQYLFSECVRQADNGEDEFARKLYDRFVLRLALVEGNLRNESSYPSQNERDRLAGLKRQLPGLSQLIGLGDAPTVG